MEERFAIRSVLLVIAVLLASLCKPTEQRPRCSPPADCEGNTLSLGEDHLRSFKSLYQSAVEDPSAMKQLLETLLMQHNEFVEVNGFGIEDEENSTERPPTATSFMGVVHQSKPIHAVENASTSIKTNEENSTERPPTKSSFTDVGDEWQNASSIINEFASSTKADEEENSTERPPIIEGNLANVVDQLKPRDDSGSKITTVTTTKDNDNEEPFWEHTTVVPQQLASPLDIHEFHFETTTIPPESIQLENLSGQVDVTTEAPVKSTKKYNTSSYTLNIPPTKVNKISYVVNIPPTKVNKKTTKRTTTKRSHVIPRPQQLDNFPNTPGVPSGNQEKIKRKPTTRPDEQINLLMPVDRDQDIRGEIQLEILNRPISTRKPSATTATPVGGATSSRPNKKPINIIPETIVKKGQKPVTVGVGKPQGSGIRNPNPSAVVASPAPSKPDDYLISALASIAGDDDEDEEEDDEEEDEEDEEEEEDGNSNESAEEEGDENEEYISGSLEENEERENFDYIDSVGARDVISSVMEEMGALI